jgi:hypothetical protein
MPDQNPPPAGQTTSTAADQQALVAQKESVCYGLRDCGLAVEPSLWSVAELDLVSEAVRDMQALVGDAQTLHKAIGGVTVERLVQGGGGAYAWWILPTWHRITLGDGVLHQDPVWRGKVAVVHEMAHVWEAQSANWVQRAVGGGGRIVHDMTAFVGAEPGPTCYGGLGAPECTYTRNPVEEWAESFAAYCYPQYVEWLRANNPNEKEAGLRPLHKQFVEMEIARLKQA